VRGHGASEERARKVAEAISLHLNVTVPARLGAEAHLLSKGVSLDVIGRRLHQIPAATTMTKQAQLRTQSRSALLHQLGFVKLIKGNPLGAPPQMNRHAIASLR
jgi:hypothetical protein